ncbi:hypothetical protein EON64_16525 [archaeon]|nr:MAG: hypothetical protein EON64_16525 [archaeon]
MGAQSSGKTLLVISMVFCFLTTLHSFSEDMGTELLSIFQSGPGMVTKRPTQVDLVHSDDDAVQLELKLDGQKGEFGSKEFDAILETCRNTQGLHKEPLYIRISSRGLPNQSFLDLPGLSVDTQHFVDHEQSLYGLLVDLAKRRNTVIVAVETVANVRQEPSNSRVISLLRLVPMFVCEFDLWQEDSYLECVCALEI